MIIRDILNMKGGRIFSIAPDGRVADAVRLMVEQDIGSLVVLDGERMAGMLTFREVIQKVVANGGQVGQAVAGPGQPPFDDGLAEGRLAGKVP